MHLMCVAFDVSLEPQRIGGKQNYRDESNRDRHGNSWWLPQTADAIYHIFGRSNSTWKVFAVTRKFKLPAYSFPCNGRRYGANRTQTANGFVRRRHVDCRRHDRHRDLHLYGGDRGDVADPRAVYCSCGYSADCSPLPALSLAPNCRRACPTPAATTFTSAKPTAS